MGVNLPAYPKKSLSNGMLTIKNPLKWLRLLLIPTVALLSGCNWVLMNPSGDVAIQQRNIILISTGLMLLIIVPVIALTLLFAWRYRKANTKADYRPDWDHSTQLELVIWAAPLPGSVPIPWIHIAR